MATIQVWKNDGKVKLGTGAGTLDPKKGKAEITAWTDKPGLEVGKLYQLHLGSKVYTDAKCDAIGLPAKFSGFS